MAAPSSSDGSWRDDRSLRQEAVARIDEALRMLPAGASQQKRCVTFYCRLS